ncbi:MAG: twin-arginine translocase TatA/TatE family subunit [Bacteroidales bacterium]|nr:twin-arginine translocase TatA/TatE family subunit [Bacteroidales bacterium]
MFQSSLLFLNRLGPAELILIVVLVLLLFGGKKIPELMRGMGRGVKEFKDAANKDYSKEEKKPETPAEEK